jgi:hypothetical protein
VGRIKHLILKREISKSILNNRFTCELCENVHIHYRNIRLEFSKQEILLILTMLKSIDEKEIERWQTGNYVYKELINENILPDDTEFDNRLQIELQEEGHYHIHYRNLRIELNNLYEFGFQKNFKQKELYTYLKKREKLLVRNISLMCYAVKFNELIKSGDYIIDEDMLLFFSNKSDLDYKFIKDKVVISDLFGTMLLKDGNQWHYYNITELPEYKFLLGDEKLYIEILLL